MPKQIENHHIENIKKCYTYVSQDVNKILQNMSLFMGISENVRILKKLVLLVDQKMPKSVKKYQRW